VLFERQVVIRLRGQLSPACLDIGQGEAAPLAEEAPETKAEEAGVAVPATDSAEPKPKSAIRNPQSAIKERRVARFWVSLETPFGIGGHSPASIGHLVGQGLGNYLGLDRAPSREGVMRSDSHDQDGVPRPSSAEASLAKRLQEARLKLLEYAQQRVTVHIPKAIFVVDRMESDAGETLRGDNPHYVFVVKNTGDAPLNIVAHPSCGCTVAKYDAVIAPGAEGKIEADVRTSGFRGKIAKSIEVTTNDSGKPQISLRLLANVISVIEAVPATVPAVALKDTEPTVKELQLRVRGSELVEVTRVSCSSPNAAARVEPAVGGYKLFVTIQPSAPLGRSNLSVTLFTSSKREPQISIPLTCEKGILLAPASLYLGAISPATKLPVTQVVTLSKREGKFRVTKVESSDPNLEVRDETVQEGSQYRLTVTYRGGWPAGAARAKLMIETDDPRQPRLEIPVIANVAAATPGAAATGQ
jgi:hypothetical protein